MCAPSLTQTHTSLLYTHTEISLLIICLVPPVHSLFSSSLLCVSSPQPVHNNGSSGYGSLGSNGSHEHYISVASSSDSNGNLWEDSHREPVRHHSSITVSIKLVVTLLPRLIMLVRCMCVIADDPSADLC